MEFQNKKDRKRKKLKSHRPQNRKHQRNNLLFPGHQEESQISLGCLADPENLHFSLVFHPWTLQGNCVLCWGPKLHPLTEHTNTAAA